MDTKTMTPVQIAHEFLGSVSAPGFSVFTPSWAKHASPQWGATCYWPNGDVLRDTSCHGSGHTLEEAIADMWRLVEDAKNKERILETPAEVKEAVIELIREHDAAPAAFRDAVDALKVKP